MKRIAAPERRFHDGVLGQGAAFEPAAHAALEVAEQAGLALSYAVFLPGWQEADGWQRLRGAEAVRAPIADAMSSDPNTIASLLERMEANGLVQRRPHEKDRRANRVELLAVAREKYEAIRDEAIELQGHVLEQLPEGDREKFLEQLEVVAQACRDVASPQR